MGGNDDIKNFLENYLENQNKQTFVLEFQPDEKSLEKYKTAKDKGGFGTIIMEVEIDVNNLTKQLYDFYKDQSNYGSDYRNNGGKGLMMSSSGGKTINITDICNEELLQK